MDKTHAASAPSESAPANASRVRLLPVSIFLLVPAMYVFGESYWSSWLAAYGLTSVTFPLSADQAVYKAYEATLILGFALLPALPSVVSLILGLVAAWVLAALVLWLWMLFGSAARNLFAGLPLFIKSLATRKKAAVKFVAQSYVMASTPFLLWGGAFYIFVILLIPLLVGHYAGQWQGDKSYEELRQRMTSENPNDSDQLIALAGNRRPLYLVTCGQSGCGGVDTGGARFVRWEDIEEIASAKLRSARKDSEMRLKNPK